MATHYPTFTAVAQTISAEGWKEVAMLRLSPLIPFNLQHYFYGITDIKLWHYVPATLVGISPGTLLYVYLGAAGKAVVGDWGGLFPAPRRDASRPQWTNLSLPPG